MKPYKLTADGNASLYNNKLKTSSERQRTRDTAGHRNRTNERKKRNMYIFINIYVYISLVTLLLCSLHSLTHCQSSSFFFRSFFLFGSIHICSFYLKIFLNVYFFRSSLCMHLICYANLRISKRAHINKQHNKKSTNTQTRNKSINRKTQGKIRHTIILYTNIIKIQTNKF